MIINIANKALIFILPFVLECQQILLPNTCLLKAISCGEIRPLCVQEEKKEKK